MRARCSPPCRRWNGRGGHEAGHEIGHDPCLPAPVDPPRARPWALSRRGGAGVSGGLLARSGWGTRSALAVLLAITLLALLAPLLTPHDPMMRVGAPFEPP